MITTDRAELEAMLNELKAVADLADTVPEPESGQEGYTPDEQDQTLPT